ncbi:ABC transporter ATP-binding protein [Alicyclobacillus kakegawensis]|uniref:ABC transporter ATP-binding protein n=1 Tax=Alicyclobacillus kakegawensis TaxID=392012 RepID=UPI0009F9D546|nr:ABC transporter ATP-binding protein [Alicyclobacillus kakegawensis]
MEHNLLSVRELTYSYDGITKVFDNFELDIFSSETIQLIGLNGVGKSTLLRILTGLISDSKLRYKAYYKGISTSLAELRNKISYVPDNPQLFNKLTCEENIHFFRLLWNNDSDYEKRVRDMCDAFGITEMLGRKVDECSLGTQHKLFLSLSLSRRADIYLMDEPFNTLDVSSRVVLTQWIQSTRDSSHLIVSHVQQEGLVFSRVIELRNPEISHCITSFKSAEKRHVPFSRSAST